MITRQFIGTTKSAEQGEIQAINNLGAMYFNGEGVTQDYAKAIYWYEQAASQGHPLPQINLAAIYEREVLLKITESYSLVF